MRSCYQMSVNCNKTLTSVRGDNTAKERDNVCTYCHLVDDMGIADEVRR